MALICQKMVAFSVKYSQRCVFSCGHYQGDHVVFIHSFRICWRMSVSAAGLTWGRSRGANSFWCIQITGCVSWCSCTHTTVLHPTLPSPSSGLKTRALATCKLQVRNTKTKTPKNIAKNLISCIIIESKNITDFRRKARPKRPRERI